jgi:PHD/YefM family antitoxin component YafN of YafNO toxin-antitoxin module
MDRDTPDIQGLPDVCTYTDFRDNMTAHFERLKKAKRPTLVTRNGRKAAVVLSPEAYERLAFGMTIEESRARIAKSIEDARQGRTRPAREVFDEIRAKLLQRKDAQQARKAKTQPPRTNKAA